MVLAGLYVKCAIPQSKHDFNVTADGCDFLMIRQRFWIESTGSVGESDILRVYFLQFQMKRHVVLGSPWNSPLDNEVPVVEIMGVFAALAHPFGWSSSM